MKFRDRQPISKSDFLHFVSNSDAEALTRAIMDSVVSINDYQWLISVYREILRTKSNKWVIGSTIVALSELVQIHSELDKEAIIKIIEPFLNIDEFRDWATNAINDVEHS